MQNRLIPFGGLKLPIYFCVANMNNPYLLMTTYLRQMVAVIIAATFSSLAASAQPPGTTDCTATRPGTQIRVYDFETVERQPSFPGGQCELTRFINRMRRYPANAYSQDIQGRVLVSFIVNTDGSISHVQVVRGVEESLNQEAVRVISEMPNWEPGFIGDHPVPVHCLLPIPFRR